MSRAPLPWRFEIVGSGRESVYNIYDANGSCIMSDTQYYPWTPEDQADWQMIVDAVNALSKISKWYPSKQSQAGEIARAALRAPETQSE